MKPLQLRSADPSGRASTTYLECGRCRGQFAMGPLMFGCPTCALDAVLSVLEVGYDREAPPPPLAGRGMSLGLGRYADLLPGGESSARVSLGEGNTPLIPSHHIGRRLGLNHLYFKNETVNPTWSFKDRYVAVTINVAKSLGFGRAVVASTGNLGVSAAAYCAAASMNCVFLAPQGVSPAILAQAKLHGAHVLLTTWEGRHVPFEHLALHQGWFPIGLFLSRPVHNPFGIEGYKAIAYEIVDDLGQAPGAVLFPCARGNGLYGAWKGFREALAFGWAAELPAMIACQPVGSNSLEVSLHRGLNDVIQLPVAEETIAFSTRETLADSHALQAIRASNGDALSATDAEILEAVGDLGREGLHVEPSSALPVACLAKLIARGKISSNDTVVCVLTGAGAKWPAAISRDDPPPAYIAPTPEAIDRYLSRVGLLQGQTDADNGIASSTRHAVVD